MFAITTVLLLGAMSGRMPSRLVMLHDPTNPDLPCPWCMSPTIEDDRDCPGCGQHFGM